MDRGEAGDQLMFVTFLFLLIIIAVGIVTGTSLFFAKTYDFRGVEADLLNNKIRECLAKNEIKFSGDNLYQQCEINKEVVDGKKLILRVCDKEEGCAQETNPLFSAGGDFVSCYWNGTEGNSNYAKCTKGVVMGKDGNSYFILTGSNQVKERLNL
jgi:hypothetical protein